MSAIRRVSRAAFASATVAESSAATSRWTGRPGSAGAGGSGSHRVRRRASAPTDPRNSDGEREIERQVKVDDQAPGRRLDALERVGDRGQERQREHHAYGAHQEVAEGQAPRGRGRGVDERRQCAAQIRTEHERECAGGIDDVRRREGGHKQHDGDARVAGPGECGRNEHREQRVAGERAHDRSQQRRVLDRSERVQESGERHQHEPEANTDAADVLGPTAGGPAKDQHADEHQGRPDQRHVEGQHLGQERGADVGAEHHGERRGERHDAGRGERGREQARRGAALEERRDPKTGEERPEATAEVAAKPTSEDVTKPALHARADHVRPPEQEAHMTCEFNE